MGEEEVNVAEPFQQLAPIGFVYLMFISLMQSVQYLISNTIEEKPNHIIEVLLASVTSGEVMMGSVVSDPDNTIVRIMPWFLLFTLYLMMNRAAVDPPLVDVVGITIVFLLSVVFVLWLSGKVFRMGVLRTGQRPWLIELLRMMRQGN